MPLFEYVCENCGCKFEKLIMSASRERQLRCPECNSAAVKKALSVFGCCSSTSSGGTDANCAPSG